MLPCLRPIGGVHEDPVPVRTRCVPVGTGYAGKLWGTLKFPVGLSPPFK